jgi:hypothetical protein
MKLIGGLLGAVALAIIALPMLAILRVVNVFLPADRDPMEGRYTVEVPR